MSAPRLMRTVPTILYDTEILGAVFPEDPPIAVDYDRNPEIYEEMYEKIDHQVSRRPSLVELGHAIGEVVGEFLPYNGSGTRRLVAGIRKNRCQQGWDVDAPIDLSVFLKAKRAICFEEALAVVVQFQLRKQRTKITGQASVEREADEDNAHTWARLADDRTVMIVDLGKSYVGELPRPIPDQLQQYLRPSERATWPR